MKSGVLTFDPAEHRYFVGGVEVPSVTTILSAAGLSDFSMVNPDILQAACELGSNVHKICELYDQDNLDESSLDYGGRSYLEGWKLFRRDFEIESFLISERPMLSTKYGYAGTPDRIAKMKGNRGKQVTVIDIKTGSARSIQTGPQLAGYAQLYREFDRLPQGLNIHRLEVVLEPGKYRVIPHIDPRHWNVFVSALNIFNYKKGA